MSGRWSALKSEAEWAQALERVKQEEEMRLRLDRRDAPLPASKPDYLKGREWEWLRRHVDGESYVAIAQSSGVSAPRARQVVLLALEKVAAGMLARPVCPHCNGTGRVPCEGGA